MEHRWFTTCCSTSEQTTLRPPTWTSMGLARILRASASMALGKVAENMTVWRSGRTLSTIRITWVTRQQPVVSKLLSTNSHFWTVFTVCSALRSGINSTVTGTAVTHIVLYSQIVLDLSICAIIFLVAADLQNQKDCVSFLLLPNTLNWQLQH